MLVVVDVEDILVVLGVHHHPSYPDAQTVGYFFTIAVEIVGFIAPIQNENSSFDAIKHLGDLKLSEFYLLSERRQSEKL